MKRKEVLVSHPSQNEDARGPPSFDSLHTSPSLLHVNGDRLGRDDVSVANQFAKARLLVSRHIEIRGHKAPKRDGHAAVVMRPAVENVPSCVVCDADEGIV